MIFVGLLSCKLLRIAGGGGACLAGGTGGLPGVTLLKLGVGVSGNSSSSGIELSRLSLLALVLLLVLKFMFAILAAAFMLFCTLG